MKPLSDVVACVVDYGTFISVAEKLAESMRLVYYHSPFETEYQDVRDVVIGTGLDRVIRLDNVLDPDVLETIDLFVFPDIGFSGLQKHLRSLGKAVWGNSGADELELDRVKFLSVIDSVGLPTPKYDILVGLTALANHLRHVRNKWIKINRFRGNIETFHHVDYAGSLRTLESLAVIFGGYRESVIFVVQDEIDTDRESGYDGWNIDGKYPSASFQGYEKKNELYLGSVLDNKDLPEEILDVNERMSLVLKTYEYRNWWATEIRVGKDGKGYFIDPTPRMPGQTGEHQLESVANFADIVWNGANGVVIKPEFNYFYAAEATMHYEATTKDPTIVDEWKSIKVPDSVARWTKLYRYAKIGGTYHFPGRNTDEIGVIIGVGPSVDGAIRHLEKNLKALEKLPIHCELSGFDELKKSIAKAGSF